MNCQDYQNLIHQMEDPSFDPDLKSKLLRHIDACPACRQDYLQIQALTARLDHLNREHQPEQDLWPEIRDRIRQSERRRIEWKYGLSGLAAGLVLIIGLITLRTSLQSSAQGLLATDPGLRKAQQECEAVRSLLTSTDAGCPVDQDLSMIIDHNLTIIRIEQQNIRYAMERNPNDAFLVDQLFQAYTQELNLLEEYLQIRLNCTRRNS